MQNEIVQTVGSVPCTSIPEYDFLPFRSTRTEKMKSNGDLWSVSESSSGASQVTSTDRDANAKVRIECSLYAAFEKEPLEDGMKHPAVGIIADALSSGDKKAILEWLKEFSLDVRQPAFAASVLRCLGRLSELDTVSWRVELVRSGLAVDNVQIRDAAVQAAEHWADIDLVSVLNDHDESERWLADYIGMVVGDIKA